VFALQLFLKMFMFTIVASVTMSRVTLFVKQRTSVFKFLAALSEDLASSGQLAEYLVRILLPLVRESTSAAAMEGKYLVQNLLHKIYANAGIFV